MRRSSWIIYSIASVLAALIWWRLSYPQLAFTNFTIDRQQATSIARTYLQQEQSADLSGFHSAAVFVADEEANRFLQRTVGFDGLRRFVEKHDFDMFYWVVRFFKEGEKEEYSVFVSSASGEIIAYRHAVEDTHPIEPIERGEAREAAINFLNERFGFNVADYTVKGDLKRIFDARTDYTFSWQKNSAIIPWSPDPSDGFGKLVRSARISGQQVLNFSKYAFLTPEQFDRKIEQLKNTGHNLSTVVRIFSFLLVFASIYFVVARRNHLAMHSTKRFYIYLVAISFVLSILTSVNQLESILFDYKTTSPLLDFLFRLGVDTFLHGLMISVILLMPGLSGELLHFEAFPQHREGAFLHFIRTSFLTRQAVRSTLLGYLLFFILLGMQSLLLEVGQHYWGVWREYSWMNQLTTAYLPLLAGFTIAYKASFTEEIMYRMFAISLGKKIFKHTGIAVIASSLIWGFAHSGYTVFPMWFRGVEVSCIGIFLSIMYLRYGILPVIVAHFLFDIFWNAAGYLFGHTNPVLFSSALFLLLIPLAFAAVAYWSNKEETERPLAWLLNKHQQYNLNILKDYLRSHWEHFGRGDKEQVKKEITSHHWDMAVVDLAVEEVSREKGD